LVDTPPLLLLFEKDREHLALDFSAFANEIDATSDDWRDVTNGGVLNLRLNGISFQFNQGEIDPIWSGFKTVFTNPDWNKLSSFLAINLGGHVDTGRISPSIVKHLLALSLTLGEKLDCKAVLWNPAQIVSGFSYFAEAVEQYQAGGPFPVLSLVDFRLGNEHSLSTSGLAWFSGQELAFEASKLPAIELMRRGVRISHDIACNGAIESDLEMDGLDAGEQLRLSPSANGQKLFVSIASKMDQ
jgi:hypothetical protein